MPISHRLTDWLTNYGDSGSFGSRLRRRRIGLLLPIIEEIHRNYGEVRIIDIGGTRKYWNILESGFLARKNIHITLFNLPGADKPVDEEHFSYLQGDACHMTAVNDLTFHIAHSNSVLEHVGDWTRMVSFSDEIKRVAGLHFVQTPNYWFPIEPHCMTPFFHWLPKPTRIWLVMNFALGNWGKVGTVDKAVRAVEGARLLNRRMFVALFPDSEVHGERLFGLRKSHIAVSKLNCKK